MSAAYSAPAGGSGGTPGGYPVFRTPVAITVARGFQVVVALAIMVMGGLLMHGLVMGPYTFAFVCGLFTLIIALYAVLSEKVLPWRAGYNYWAVLALDLLMIIFWLSSMAAVAHLRSTFKYNTYVECYDNGNAFNANFCYTYKRSLAKRAAVAGKVALAEMSAIAGLSALETLLFVATFAYLAHQLRLHHRAVQGGVASNEAGVVEMKISPQPPAPTDAPAAPPFLPTYSAAAPVSSPVPAAAPVPAPVTVPASAPAPAPAPVPQNYYELQNTQTYSYAQQPGTTAAGPAQASHSPYAYQPQPTPTSPAPAPPLASVPSPVPTPGPYNTYNVSPPAGTPELAASAPGYPAQTISPVSSPSPYEK